ncbi:MAG: hypothetical protein LBD20_02640 [Spirochaetaceae bacterium]|jgi:hypothetical protein|nr:hypothetical protein [Spirochaetaceae bacterium]
MEITISNSIAKHFAELQKSFKRQAPVQQAALLNDMAFKFREAAPLALGTRYIIRQKRFVSQSFHIMKKARPADGSNMAAEVTSNYFGHKKGAKFTGWTEELGGEETRSAFFTLRARGGNKSNNVYSGYRIKRGNDGYNSAPPPPELSYGLFANLPPNRKFPALQKALRLKKTQRSQIDFRQNIYDARSLAYGKTRQGDFKTRRKMTRQALYETDPVLAQFDTQASPIFIMNFYGIKGLFTFNNNYDFSGGIEALRYYTAPRKKVPRWGWDIIAVNKVYETFSDDYILNNYIVPIMRAK